MCTVWAALFLFLSLSVSVPLFPTFLLLLVFVVRLLSLSPSLLHFVSQRPFSFSPASFRPSFPILRLCSSLSLSLAFSLSLSPSPRTSPSASVSRPPRPFSLVISSSFARSRFFSRFFHRPPIFPLPCVRLPSFFCPPSSASTSLRAHLFPFPSIFLPPALPLSTYPRRLRRDGPIFSSRFLGSDIFYTFFLPPPAAAHAPLPPARVLFLSLFLSTSHIPSRQQNTASSIRSVSLHLTSHIRT